MTMRFYSALLLLTSAAALTTVSHAEISTPRKSAAAKPFVLSENIGGGSSASLDAETEEKVLPAQSSVAAKAAFATIDASDKSVGQALDAKALADARKMIGKPGAFQGVVSQVYSPHNHNIVILDFAPHYRDALTASMKPDDYAKFPDTSQLAGKHVLITGVFSANPHGAPQIELASPDQVKIIP
ncbi:hypothetical protein CCAX7_57350 [Capsulimonas corticalis]|uniref:Uncharacterized protein n=1 Tax=Capsulimonas corticalis TaxID=2219043 RepID=A0A402D0E6_9BACT|nr:hypothetical protein [Capsulimonas corticalis]BDI33684.1 hypothetical protein CCAX7_57350 [Capsulimonas corticalis]